VALGNLLSRWWAASSYHRAALISLSRSSIPTRAAGRPFHVFFNAIALLFIGLTDKVAMLRRSGCRPT
jgi:hypothetical protein